MNATLTEAGITALFDNPPAPGFQLWFRPGRGHPWEVVAVADTHSECVDAIGIGGRRGGHWIALPVGQEP
ncbi:unnamed protein product [Gemmataceae bacterium]|nr:unnamed protein product [Gemmataceae bacterium]VTT99074.1 unnamed protein product [Gemmataceae bacterium]